MDIVYLGVFCFYYILLSLLQQMIFSTTDAWHIILGLTLVLGMFVLMLFSY